MSKEWADKVESIFDKVVMPLVRNKRYSELRDRITELLDTESDPHLRGVLMNTLASHLHVGGMEEESLLWAKRQVEEFPEDPLAWSGLGSWYYYNPLREATSQEMNIAKEHYETALEKARASNEWVCSELYTLCRLLTDMKNYEELEARMREILHELTIKRETDVPQFECDWLKRVPDGKIDSDLVETFWALEVKDRRRVQKLRYDSLPPTLDELNSGKWDADESSV